MSQLLLLVEDEESLRAMLMMYLMPIMFGNIITSALMNHGLKRAR